MFYKLSQTRRYCQYQIVRFRNTGIKRKTYFLDKIILFILLISYIFIIDYKFNGEKLETFYEK